jgi:hypothetical protein
MSRWEFPKATVLQWPQLAGVTGAMNSPKISAKPGTGIANSIRNLFVAAFAVGFAVVQIFEFEDPWHNGPWDRLLGGWIVCYVTWCVWSFPPTWKELNARSRFLRLVEFALFAGYVWSLNLLPDARGLIPPAITACHIVAVIAVRRLRAAEPAA